MTLALTVLPGVVAAQGSPVADAFKQNESQVAKNLIAAAEEVPANKYMYRPTAPQMTVAAVVVHLIQGNDYLCGKITGAKAPTRAKVDTTSGKDALVAQLRESFQFCDQSLATYQNLGQGTSIPFQHSFKLNANVPLWYGFEISASLQSYPGAPKATTNGIDNGGVTWTINRGTTRYPTDCAVPGCTPGAVVLPSRFAGDPAVAVRLPSPGTRYEPRWNQLDLGLRRTFRFARGVTVQGQVDLFNALNSNTVLTEGTALSTSVAPFLSSDPGAGGTPTSILQPRILRLAAQFRF